jgi:hypothetical protein
MTEQNLIHHRADKLAEEYQAIVRSTFAGVTKVGDLIPAFNQRFFRYQRSMTRKLAPESLKKGEISCSSASAIVGMWWFLLTELEPTFFVQLYNKNKQLAGRKAHTVVGLDRTGKNPAQLEDLYLQRSTEGYYDPDTFLLDYVPAHGLYHAHPDTAYFPAQVITGNQNYLRNRVRVLTVKSQIFQT